MTTLAANLTAGSPGLLLLSTISEWRRAHRIQSVLVASWLGEITIISATLLLVRNSRQKDGQGARAKAGEIDFIFP
jgi:hypothetical protein